MRNKVVFSPDAAEELLKGVNVIGNAVGATLGPRGRNAILKRPYKDPHITKDGVTVAKFIQLEDTLQGMGASIIKQAAEYSANTSGDGTTTATVLAQALCNEAFKLIKLGISPIEIKRRFELHLQEVEAFLKTISSPTTIDDVYKIALISSNNDEQLAEIFAAIFQQIDLEGVVYVEDSKSATVNFQITQGSEYLSGSLSPYFIDDLERQKTVLENPLIFITDKKLRGVADVIPLMEIAVANKRPLFIIADTIEQQALQILIVNKLQQRIKVAAVQAPAFGDRRAQILQDLSILTSAELYSEVKAQRIEDVNLSHFGSAEKIVVTPYTFSLVSPTSNQDLLEAKIQEVKASIPKLDGYLKEKAIERVAKLTAKSAIIYAGAATEAQLDELKDRIDDTVKAVKSALEQGYVVGGGKALYLASQSIELDNPIDQAFATAILSPISKIFTNAGLIPEVIFSKFHSPNSGWDFQKDQVTDYINAGVIDPLKVVISSLTAAVSAASTLILSDVAVYSDEESFQPDRSYENQI